MISRQQQTGGEGATLAQAGNDIVIHQGPNIDQIREVALDVFRANFLELRGVAEEVALGRAEKVTREYLEALQNRSPDALNSTGDPDVVRSIVNVQTEFACSGEEDLGQILVDLLVERSVQETRGIEAVVLNEAIKAAPKLTVDQRRAVAACFLTRYTRYTGPKDLDAYYEMNVQRSLVPFSRELPKRASAYQHIDYVGAGSVGIGEASFLDAILSGAAGYFTRGFLPADVPEALTALLGDPGIFQGSLRGEGKIQLAAMCNDDVVDVVKAIGREDLKAPMSNLLGIGRMTPEEILDEMEARAPGMREMADAWDGSSLKNLTLTTVGIAIGHGYWRRTVGEVAPLSIWL